MSEQNVEVVRRWIDAYNRRDFDAITVLTDPTFEFQSRFVALESVFRAGENFPHGYFQMLDEAYGHFEITPSEFIDAGTAVLVVARAQWRGKVSGAEGETHILPVFWLRTGKVVRAETFTDRAEAFDAVGLSTQDAQSEGS